MKIKICGLFNRADIDYVNEALPDYAGFVFAESKRRISFETAREFKKRLDARIKSVGVFVNAAVSDIARLYADDVIDIAQLHGDESPEYSAKLKDYCGIPIIKAIIGRERWRGYEAADYLLFDSGKGTGKTFDWSLIPEQPKPFFLAGGINIDNIAEAVRVNPYCIDISGGAESNGVKDKEKIKKCVEIARSYNG